MRATRRKQQRGVALLMVLVALTILGSMTADLMETNEVYLATTVNARNDIRAEYMARSGVNLSRLLLSFQRILGGSLNFPFWQYADLVVGMFAGGGDEGGGGMADMIGLDLSEAEGLGLGIDDSDLMVTIIDEDSKINVNRANDQGRGDQRKRMLDQLVSLLSPPEYDHLFERELKTGETVERQDVVCELMDWTDPDEDLCDMSGSEDPSLYQVLDPEYERKNAPFDSLMELQLVRGIDDDFWSAFVEPDAEDPASRVMTIWGKGRVNVNTAPAQVLFPLVCMLSADENGVSPCADPAQLFNLLQILQGVVTIRSLMPFNKTKDFVSAIENPERLFLMLPGFPIFNKRLARQLFTTRSTVFSIYAEGTVGKVTKRIHMVVDMKSEDLLMLDPANADTTAAAGGKVLYWRME